MEDAPSSSAVVAPSEPWQLPECQRRRCGSANIFHGLGLRQLQRLFHRSGDRDAERRARLVWGRSDGTELARALIGIRTGTRRGCARGPRWLREFDHLSIGEVSPVSPAESSEICSEPEPDRGGSQESGLQEPAENRRVGSMDQSQSAPAWNIHIRHRLGREDEEERNPERYLHRVLRRPSRPAQGQPKTGWDRGGVS